MPTSLALREAHKKDEIKYRIFDLLQECGPLNVLQIVMEVLVPRELVIQCLEELEREGLATLRPDPGVDQTKLSPQQQVWGICTLLTGHRPVS